PRVARELLLRFGTRDCGVGFFQIGLVPARSFCLFALALQIAVRPRTLEVRLKADTTYIPLRRYVASGFSRTMIEVASGLSRTWRDARERLESCRLQRLCQASMRLRRVRGERQRFKCPRHRIGRLLRSDRAGKAFRFLHRIGDRMAVLIGRRSHVGRLPLERGDLRLAQALAALE